MGKTFIYLLMFHSTSKYMKKDLTGRRRGPITLVKYYHFLLFPPTEKRHVGQCALTYSLILHTLPFEPAVRGATQRGMVHVVVHTLTIYPAVERQWRTSLWNRCNDPDSAFTFVSCHSKYTCVISACVLSCLGCNVVHQLISWQY